VHEDEVSELEQRIAEMRRRIPPHSIPPAMLEELEELEMRLDEVRRRQGQG
jgi:hypothetical protein